MLDLLTYGDTEYSKTINKISPQWFEFEEVIGHKGDRALIKQMFKTPKGDLERIAEIDHDLAVWMVPGEFMLKDERKLGLCIMLRLRGRMLKPLRRNQNM